MTDFISDNDYDNFYKKFTGNDKEYNKKYNDKQVELEQKIVLFLKEVDGIYVFKQPDNKIHRDLKYGPFGNERTLQQDFTEDLNLELYFWSDSSKTRDLFLEMINGEFSAFNQDYSDLEDKETRFTLKIEKFDLYKAWTYLSLLEERRQKEK